jgi:signal transduction histidine kinase
MRQVGAGPRTGLSTLDVAIPAVLAVVGSVEALLQAYEPVWVTAGSCIAACVALCFRRIIPALITPAVAVMYGLGAIGGSDMSDPAVWLLIFPFAALATGLHTSRLVIGLASVAVALLLSFGALSGFTAFAPDPFFGTIAFFGPWGIGLALRRTNERNQELGRQIEHERMEQEAATATERHRIARELHDVLAHSLSVMVVQASLAEDLLRSSPDNALAALQEVQRSGRRALAEASDILRVIRDGSGDMIAAPGHDTNDIPDLVDEFIRAGLDVRLELDPRVHSLPLGAGLSIYRIVQEGLTNALKHAAGTRVAVTIERRNGSVTVEVHSGGGTTRARVGAPSGHGLRGLRERVALFGGTFDAGPTPDRGFLVRATLPVVDASA